MPLTQPYHSCHDEKSQHYYEDRKESTEGPVMGYVRTGDYPLCDCSDYHKTS